MRYILAAIGIVVLIIFVVIIVMRGSSGPSSKSASANTVTLTDYINKDSQVTLTTYGPVVGNDQRQAVRITVSPNNRFFSILRTYESLPENAQVYGNNQTAYSFFMHSLSGLGFSNERTVKNQDELGACPFGQVTVYQLFSQGKQVLNTWSSNCTTKDGTFAGSASGVTRLFQAQITNYSELTANLNY